MGRGGRTITVGRQGPQKFFQVPKSLEKFLLSAPLQPLTANSDCAHGGQPKSPRPISAGRHVFILEPGAPRRKEHNIEKINRQAKTVGCWEEILVPIEVEALHDTYHTNPEEVLTPNEVLDIIVEWNGGIASGYHIRSIISRVYGVEL